MSAAAVHISKALALRATHGEPTMFVSDRIVLGALSGPDESSSLHYAGPLPAHLEAAVDASCLRVWVEDTGALAAAPALAVAVGGLLAPMRQTVADKLRTDRVRDLLTHIKTVAGSVSPQRGLHAQPSTCSRSTGARCEVAVAITAAGPIRAAFSVVGAVAAALLGTSLENALAVRVMVTAMHLAAMLAPEGALPAASVLVTRRRTAPPHTATATVPGSLAARSLSKVAHLNALAAHMVLRSQPPPTGVPPPPPAEGAACALTLQLAVAPFALRAWHKVPLCVAVLACPHEELQALVGPEAAAYLAAAGLLGWAPAAAWSELSSALRLLFGERRSQQTPFVALVVAAIVASELRLLHPEDSDPTAAVGLQAATAVDERGVAALVALLEALPSGTVDLGEDGPAGVLQHLRTAPVGAVQCDVPGPYHRQAVVCRRVCVLPETLLAAAQALLTAAADARLAAVRVFPTTGAVLSVPEGTPAPDELTVRLTVAAQHHARPSPPAAPPRVAAEQSAFSFHGAKATMAVPREDPHDGTLPLSALLANAAAEFHCAVGALVADDGPRREGATRVVAALCDHREAAQTALLCVRGGAKDAIVQRVRGPLEARGEAVSCQHSWGCATYALADADLLLWPLGTTDAEAAERLAPVVPPEARRTLADCFVRPAARHEPTTAAAQDARQQATDEIFLRFLRLRVGRFAQQVNTIFEPLVANAAAAARDDFAAVLVHFVPSLPPPAHGADLDAAVRESPLLRAVEASPAPRALERSVPPSSVVADGAQEQPHEAFCKQYFGRVANDPARLAALQRRQAAGGLGDAAFVALLCDLLGLSPQSFVVAEHTVALSPAALQHLAATEPMPPTDLTGSPRRASSPRAASPRAKSAAERFPVADVDAPDSPRVRLEHATRRVSATPLKTTPHLWRKGSAHKMRAEREQPPPRANAPPLPQLHRSDVPPSAPPPPTVSPVPARRSPTVPWRRPEKLADLVRLTSAVKKKIGIDS